MSAREEDRVWLADDIDRAKARGHRSFGEVYVETFGWEGTLDLLALQSGRVWDVNLTHRPFAHDEELKELVRVARQALHDTAAAAFRIGYAALDRDREAEQAAAAEAVVDQ